MLVPWGTVKFVSLESQSFPRLRSGNIEILRKTKFTVLFPLGTESLSVKCRQGKYPAFGRMYNYYMAHRTKMARFILMSFLSLPHYCNTDRSDGPLAKQFGY